MGNTRKLFYLEEKTNKAFGSQGNTKVTFFVSTKFRLLDGDFLLFILFIYLFIFLQNTLWMGFLVFMYLLCKIIVLFKKIYKYTFFI